MMRAEVLLLIGATVMVLGLAYATGSEVSQRTLWIIPWDYEEQLTVQPGDVIELRTRPLPVIQENLGTRFRASREGRAVDLVGEALPHKEGTMERLFYFKAFEPGSALLKVELLDKDGIVKSSYTYRIQVGKGQVQLDEAVKDRADCQGYSG